MPVSHSYRPAPLVTTLGDGFYDEVAPARFPAHTLRFRNQRWAERIGLGSLDDAEWAAHLARFESLPDNLTTPLALRYHGHQFDVYNPGLGDGRGFLFAQLRDDAGRLLESRDERERDDAVVTRGRRPPHPQGRSSRSTRDRDARSPRRRHVQVAEPVRDR